jgi:glutathione S-transferase
MVELYHFWSSVCSVRCRMALEEKGVAWTSRYIDLFKFDQLRPEYLAINPDGVVPTLVHDGVPIHESTIINEYIDTAFEGPKLVPSEPILQARMREFVRKCEDDFDAIVKLTMVKYIFPKLKNRWGVEELTKQAARRPKKYYQDIHSRAVRGEITEQDLAESRTIIEGLLDDLRAGP